MKHIITTIAAALAAVAMTGCANSDERLLQEAWDQTSSEDQASICMGFAVFPEVMPGIVREELVENDLDIDPDTAVEFFEDKCQ